MPISISDLGELVGYDPESHTMKGLPSLKPPATGSANGAPIKEPQPPVPPTGIPSMMGSVVPNAAPMDGIPSLQKPPTSTLSKIGHGIGKVGEIAGDVAIPNIMSRIPGTQLHNEFEQKREAGLAGEQAETGLKNATAKATEEGGELVPFTNAAGETTQVPEKIWGPLEAAEERANATKESADTRAGATTDAAKIRADAEKNKPETLSQLQAKWADSLAGQINPATGKNYTPQESLAAVEPVSRQVHDAFTEWQQSHPDGTYDDFLKDTGNLKRGGSVGQAIAMSRLLNAGYSEDPRLLQFLPQILQGMGVSGAQSAGISGAPAGQPVGAGGEPVGLRSPEAPTGATRTSAQTADRVLTEIPNIKKSIADMGDNLGPIMGRWNDFETGRIGAGDPKFEALRTNMQFLAAAAAKFHLNSVRAVEEFNKLADTGKMTPQILNAYVDTVGHWAQTASNQGKGVQPGGGVPAGAVPGTMNGKHGYVLNGQFHAE